MDIEKLKIRKSGIGGSDIAAICGMSPWKTPIDIYLDKTTDDISNETSKAAAIGQKLESFVANLYSEKTGYEVLEEEKTLRHDKHNFAIANIDRWVNDKSHILECKTTNFMKREEWGEEETAEIPYAYLMQVAWYAFVCNKPKVDVAVLIGGQDFRIYKYERQESLENKLFKIAEKFWHENVLAKNPPPLMNPQDATKLYKNSSDTEIVATDEIMEKVGLLQILKSKMAEVDNDIKNLQAEIQGYMGNNGILLDPYNRTLATWKQTKPRNSFDLEAFKKTHPDLHLQYAKEGKSYRTFLIKNNI